MDTGTAIASDAVMAASCARWTRGRGQKQEMRKSFDKTNSFFFISFMTMGAEVQPVETSVRRYDHRFIENKQRRIAGHVNYISNIEGDNADVTERYIKTLVCVQY